MSSTRKANHSAGRAASNAARVAPAALIVLVIGMLITHPAQAQTNFKSLYSFEGDVVSDGWEPGSWIRDSAGNLYGSTEYGGLPKCNCRTRDRDYAEVYGNAVQRAPGFAGFELFLEEIQRTRLKEIDTISTHMEISLNELIHRQNLRMADLLSGDHSREANPLLSTSSRSKIRSTNSTTGWKNGGTRLSVNDSARLPISSTMVARGSYRAVVARRVCPSPWVGAIHTER